jgi:hypothetical protein
LGILLLQVATFIKFVELLRCQREAAPPSFEAAVKGAGPVDGAAAKRTASA